MKPVTQSRILKALDNLFDRTHNNKTMKQTQAFALHGLKSFIGSLQPIDSDKLELELALIEGDRPTNPEDFSVKLDRMMDVHHCRRSRILDIQVKHGVSGLEWQHIEHAKNSFHFLAFTDILRPTPSDMQLLAKHKYFVVQHWIDHAVATGLTAYKDTDDQWEPTAIDWIWAKSRDFNWATISLDKYYLSPTMMRFNGYDTRRNKPELLDDELYIESHLTIGRGEDFDSSNANILWFCAANHLPSS